MQRAVQSPRVRPRVSPVPRGRAAQRDNGGRPPRLTVTGESCGSCRLARNLREYRFLVRELLKRPTT
eukprot:1318099-Prymnesium_polylepis.1